jgi:hypothetical protein
MVARVVALWQAVVRVEGEDWPTNRKPLVPLAGGRTRRGGGLADQSQTACGTRAGEGEDNREGSAPPNDPSTSSSTGPCTCPQKTELPQLIWGTACNGASGILRAWGIKYLTTASPCEL